MSARIGLFGGTFDPPHLGHLIAAERVRDVLGLDAVWFVPNHIPPHKNPAAHASAVDRLHMVQLAIAGVDHFAVSTIEYERDTPSYTIDTVTALRARHPDVSWTFIIGEDALSGLFRWHRAAELIPLIDWAVLRRPGKHEGHPAPDADVDASRFHLVDMPRIDISSSVIRAFVARGASIRFLVPEAVRRYIIERGLYRR
ncbi:MAG: nicotinate (nicotinamide) nucleotide adenylyltransferase [Hydrogenibacillus sp.]|nr:nicotinate (nicotinamide) nucleotide adenylyltransferase [Hydrogenibacillus sp.]